MPTGSRLARRIHSEGGHLLVDLSRPNERGGAIPSIGLSSHLSRHLVSGQVSMVSLDLGTIAGDGIPMPGLRV